MTQTKYFQLISNNFGLNEDQKILPRTFFYEFKNFQIWDYNKYEELMLALYKLSLEPFDERSVYFSDIFSIYDYIQGLFMNHFIVTNTSEKGIFVCKPFTFSRNDLSEWFYTETMRQAFVNVFNRDFNQKDDQFFYKYWADLEKEYQV